MKSVKFTDKMNYLMLNYAKFASSIDFTKKHDIITMDKVGKPLNRFCEKV